MHLLISLFLVALLGGEGGWWGDARFFKMGYKFKQ